MFPLRAAKSETDSTRIHDRLHDIHFADFLFQSCWWSLEMEEQHNKDRTEGTYRYVEVCMHVHDTDPTPPIKVPHTKNHLLEHKTD